MLLLGALASESAAMPCGEAAYAPGIGARASFPPATQATSVSLTGLGLLKCNAFELDCEMTVRRIALDVAQSLPGVQCGAGIYQRTHASAVALGRTPVLDCSDAAAPISTGGAAIEATLDYPVTLQPFTEYLGCAAFSVNGTTAVKYEAPRAIPLFIALDHASTYNADLGNLARAAQFSAACTGAGTPWACCSGNGSGSCAGLPGAIHHLTPQWTHGPLLKLGW